VNRLELLIDVLEGRGFTELRREIEERETELTSSLKLSKVLTETEVADVRRTLSEMNLPNPTGWANALYTHELRRQTDRFSPRRDYDYYELGNLLATLREAGLKNAEVFRKIESLKATLKTYS
jgi:hypothetical protein